MEYVQNLLSSLSLILPSANISQFFEIINGIYSISSGGVTQLNISRYCSISYRSVQRFMSQDINWLSLNLHLLQRYITDSFGAYLLVIDETVEDKAGKSTDKIGYFYSSKAGKAIKSVSFGVLSLVSVNNRKSFVLDFEQMEQDVEKKAKRKAEKVKKASEKAKKEASQKAALASGAPLAKKQAGRKLGSKNKNATKVANESYRVLELLLQRVLPLLLEIVAPRYLVGDGAYGNLTGCLIASEHNLFLISKLHYNSALYYAPEKGTKNRIYGEKVDFDNLAAHKIDSEEDENYIYTFYQLRNVRTKNIKQPLNVVVISCFSKTTKKTGIVILFSTDLELEAMTLVDYYSLRFQIEFNFRDAKQHFGLSDFKSTKPTQVKNAVGLSFFMCNLSLLIADEVKKTNDIEIFSILDIKACFRAILYSKILKNTPVLSLTNILDTQNIHLLQRLGVVNLNGNNNKNTKCA